MDIAHLNPLRYRGYYYDSETGLYYLQSRYYDPENCQFINADNYLSTGQGFVGHNAFAYCGNNPVNIADATGDFSIWNLPLIGIFPFVLFALAEKSKDDVLVISNAESDWMSSSETMGKDMASAVRANSSHVEAATTENFSDIWNNTTSSHVIIHTHGSPNVLAGDNLWITTNDMSQMQRNENIHFVLITACEVGGDNGEQLNMGQVISQKISSTGFVVCSTTVVSGASKEFTATKGGQWVVYQNGVQVGILQTTTITMKIASRYPKPLKI